MWALCVAQSSLELCEPRRGEIFFGNHRAIFGVYSNWPLDAQFRIEWRKSGARHSRLPFAIKEIEVLVLLASAWNPLHTPSGTDHDARRDIHGDDFAIRS